MPKENINDLLFAFSEETRLRILMLLGRESALCVKCIVGAIEAPQPTVSRHLSTLRRSGVVRMEKDEQHHYYSIRNGGPADGLAKGLADFFYRSLKDRSPFKRDFAKLEKVAKGCALDCKLRH